eukprot:gene28222-31880_t
MTIKVHHTLLMTGAAGGLGTAMRDRLKANCEVLRLSDRADFGTARAGDARARARDGAAGRLSGRSDALPGTAADPLIAIGIRHEAPFGAPFSCEKLPRRPEIRVFSLLARNFPPMNAIKVARRFIETDPANESAKILAQLVLALESERSFELVTLYSLDYKSFQLAMDILKEWRLDRYYASKSASSTPRAAATEIRRSRAFFVFLAPAPRLSPSPDSPSRSTRPLHRRSRPIRFPSASRTRATRRACLCAGARRERERHNLFDVMELATQFFQEQLQSASGAKARAYLRDRGLTGRTIETFRLGYSSDSRNALKEFGKLIDGKLENQAHAALAAAGELEGWQRWRADQL